MSIADQITAIEGSRNTIRNKLVELGMAQSDDKLDRLAVAMEGIANQGAVSATVAEGDTYTIPAGYHNGSGTVSGVTGDGSGGSGKDGEDGGYYVPSVNSDGILTWEASKSEMPAVDSVNIKGQKGDKGDKGDTGEQGIQGEAGADGNDGFSPIVTIYEMNGCHRVQITDKDGTNSFDVMDAPSEIISATSSDGIEYIATVPSITALTPGVNFIMRPSMASASTTPTLNVNNLGTKTLRQPLTTNTSATAPGTANDWLVSGKPVRVMYDGIYWKTVEIPRPSAAGLYGVVPVANGGVPASTVSDNGKLLRVVEGVPSWAADTSVSTEQVVNNFTTTEEGFVADARALKVLYDDMNTISSGEITLTDIIPSDATVRGTTVYYTKNVAYIGVQIEKFSASVPVSSKLFTLPVKPRFGQKIMLMGNCDGNPTYGTAYINAAGQVSNNLKTGTWISFSIFGTIML